MKVFKAGRPVNLTDAMLLAAGGEGTVYGDANWCYKVYHDRARALPEAKFRELAALTHPAVVRPQHLLTDESGGVVGYAMNRVKNPQDLPPLFTRSFRERRKVKPEKVFGLVLKLREVVEAAHAAHCLVVDLNELNFLAAAKLDGVWAIDVDSWQTPSFPATAIMETVRDRHAKKRGSHYEWTRGTDWFSFAVLATQLLVGIHPYRGRHPDCHPADSALRLEARMKANLSVFNPKTVLPPPCFPVSEVPPAYRAWLTAVLEKGERSAAPESGELPAAVVVPAAPAPTVVGPATGVLKFKEVLVLPAGERVAAIRSGPHDLYALTASGYVYGVSRHMKTAGYMAALPAGEDHDLALTPNGRVLVAYYDPAADLACVNLPDGTRLFQQAGGRPVVTADGRVLVKTQNYVLELSWLDGARPVAGTRVAANVLEQAALFPGVVVQRRVDAWYATVFPAAGKSYQVRLPELEARRVVDARYEAGVLLVAAVDPKSGRYDELLYRFSPDHAARDVREDRDVTYSGLALTVLPKGAAIQLCADGKVDAFRSALQSGGTGQPAGYDSGGRLTAASPVGRRGDEVLVAEGGTVYHLTLGK